jgi:hypothetical protein
MISDDHPVPAALAAAGPGNALLEQPAAKVGFAGT